MNENYATTLHQSNVFTTCRCNYSRTERNVLYVIIKKVRQQYIEGTMKNGNWNNFYVELNSNQFSKITDVNHTAKARAALMSLCEKKIKFIDANGNWVNCGIVNSAIHITERNVYRVEVSRDFMPYLVELVSRFTAYRLTVVLSLKSVYSQRLYELCCMYKKRGYFFYSGEELRIMLKVEDKYPQKYEFEKNVLRLAQKEIKKFFDTQEADCYFESSAKGRGRKTTYSFIIHVRDEEIQKRDLDEYYHHCSAYIYRKSQMLFPKDRNFCNKICHYMINHPVDIDAMYNRLVKIEKKEDTKNLPALWRYILKEDFLKDDV